jgi:hypothetical protein
VELADLDQGFQLVDVVAQALALPVGLAGGGGAVPGGEGLLEMAVEALQVAVEQASTGPRLFSRGNLGRHPG